MEIKGLLSVSWGPQEKLHRHTGKVSTGGRGQNSPPANQAESHIPLAHFKQAHWKESFHTILRILDSRYQQRQANKAAVVLIDLVYVSRYNTAAAAHNAYNKCVILNGILKLLQGEPICTYTPSSLFITSIVFGCFHNHPLNSREQS